MEAAIDRIMQTYDLLMNRGGAASAEARVRVEAGRRAVGSGIADDHAPGCHQAAG